MKVDEEDYLIHYGILRKSGRYPWGSGGSEGQRSKDFLAYFDDLKKQGLSEAEIAKGVGITVNQYRNTKSAIRAKNDAAKIAQIERLAAKGMSNGAIAQRMGLAGESSVRALLAPGKKERASVLQNTANMLKDRVDSTGGFIDVGIGVERHVTGGLSATQLKAAVGILEEKGYVVHRTKFEQLGTGKLTEMKVLCPPGTTEREVNRNQDKIQQIRNYTNDGGRSFMAIQPPININSSRIAINYKEDGGATKDGVIYVRRGVEDLDMGSARYAQVRIAVDGSHYLKGMALYKDDMPEGTDLIFNTNKSNTGNKHDAMKPMREEPIDSPTYNPFGSFVRQLPKRDAEGNDIKGTVRSALNIVNEEGKWEKWSDNLASQMLSKQNLSLAKGQLDLTYRGKKADLDEIKSLTNPAIRKKLLLEYADDADSAAIHLKAMGLSGQGNHVILPIDSMKENEVFAPRYNNGERVVLVRFPHGGPFEIPELTVNNKHPEALRLIGKDAPDAVGINSKVAERLSGADFDGDSVLVIPNNSNRIKTKPPLEGLKNFDHRTQYQHYEGMHRMTSVETQREMGYVSNLITDMSIRGANDTEMAAAVRHSMVVIDAEKHYLNYKQSEVDNNIPTLRRRYQNSAQGGAKTLISRSGLNSKVPVNQRKQNYDIDPATGKKIYTETGRTYRELKVEKDPITGEKIYIETGKVLPKTEKVPRLSLVDDAHTLSSGTPIEKVYADHSNRMKALANEARKEYVNTKNIEVNPTAKKTYAREVTSLDNKLHIALRNAPLERQAQLLALANVKARSRANPDMDTEEVKKLKNLALIEARNRMGAKKKAIEITDSEWNAIQSNALTQTTVDKILRNTDIDLVKKRATPHTTKLMTTAKIQRALMLKNSGATLAEIASTLGVSQSTLKRELGSS